MSLWHFQNKLDLTYLLYWRRCIKILKMNYYVTPRNETNSECNHSKFITGKILMKYKKEEKNSRIFSHHRRKINIWYIFVNQTVNIKHRLYERVMSFEMLNTCLTWWLSPAWVIVHSIKSEVPVIILFVKISWNNNFFP